MTSINQHAEAAAKLQELLDLEEGLSKWEMEFVDSVAKQREFQGAGFSLSRKQIDKINQIHADRIG